MTISPWICLMLTPPVLFLGEAIVRRVRVLGAFSVPAAVVGGLVVATLVLLLNVAVPNAVVIDTKVVARWWTWVILAEPEWFAGTPQPIHQPLVVAFFTCVGLIASWRVVKQGSWPLLVFLVLAGVMGVLQNAIGAALAVALHQSPLLGIVCGGVSLTGGHGTAIGFADTLEKAGFAQAGVVGAAAATYGIIAGSLLGGPTATFLIRRHRIRCLGPTPRPQEDAADIPPAMPSRSRLVSELIVLGRTGGGTLFHVALLLACIKAGAWLSYAMRSAGLTFPPQIGAMTVGVVARNLFDLSDRSPVRTDLLTLISSVLLSVFLAFAMISLNLSALTNSALPMLAILSAQTVLMLLFAYVVTFKVMGRTYEAAVISAGHVGFGLGVVSNAIASMDALAGRFGRAERAVLIVVLVGAYLNDFTNALNVACFIQWVK